MKKVIVTGGAGFIGSNLVDRLIDMGVEVVILDNLSTGKENNVNPKAEFIKCDLTKDRPLFNDVDTVFHLAATPQVQHSIENPTDNNNIDSAVYGNPKYVPIDENHTTNPLSPYALHKLIGEQYCKLYSDIYGLDTVCLRYFNVYGNRMSNEGAYKSVISVFKDQYNEKQPLNIVNDGEQKRDFVSVNDVIQTNILCATNPDTFKGNIYNIGTGTAYTVNEIADMFGGEKQYSEKRIEPKNSIAENAKIRLELDFDFTNDLKNFITKVKQEIVK